MVNDLDLKEIPLLGRRYTWSNEREAPTLIKLDRVLCTIEWEAMYPEVILHSQAVVWSLRGLTKSSQLSIPYFDKKEEAMAAKDFRPIILIHSFAKLITKIMANRLTPFLDSLVATTQSAFIKGKCIHDNFILVQQTIKLLHKWKVSSLFLKLDISKAFDSVTWSFLREILGHLGFDPMWKNLITCLLHMTTIRILLNG
jgi:hypothetical protein